MTAGGSANDDLFPGFATHRIDVPGASIFARVGGAGPGLLLLHGYPQSHAMWHRLAQTLAHTHTVVAADLRGYGQSSCPPTDMQHRAYSKRTMARDMLAVTKQLGLQRFSVMGHDRGARVAYRLALDHPETVHRLLIVDILPTPDQWAAANQSIRLKMFHWPFLAQPAPMPESLIGNNPDQWLDTRLRRGTRAGSIEALDPRSVASYRSAFRDPNHIHATCEDFRAGASCDLDDDTADLAAGRRIAAPTLMLWATHGPLSDVEDPLSHWRPWCQSLQGAAIESGHFIAEEAPDALLAKAEPFLRS